LLPLVLNNRGRLLYKDYRDYGSLDSFVLRDSDWDIPSDQVYPYASGSKPGPYNVADDSGEGDRSLVIDFELDADRDWVGIQLPVIPGKGLVDLSSLDALYMSYRAIDMGGTVDLYLQIGDLAEDLDDDDILDEEFSSSSTGFSFDDPLVGSLLVGGGPKQEGNLRVDSEDIDGNGVLDPEDVDFIYEPTATVRDNITANTGWNTDQIYFTAADDRQRLTRVRAARLLVVANGGGATGRILVDDIELAGSTYGVIDAAVTDREKIEVREIRESHAVSKPSKELEDASDTVSDVFHPSGQIQKVLEVDWSGLATPAFTVRGYTETGTEGARYRRIVHYLRADNLSASANLEFELLDAEERGIRWSFDVDPGDYPNWTEVTVDHEDKRLRIDGNEPTGAKVSVDGTYDSLVEFRVKVKDADQGTLYIDELHLTEPVGQVGGALSLDTTFRRPGTLLAAGDVPIISDLVVREIIDASSPGFATLYGRPTQVWSTNTRTEVGMGLLAAQLDMNLTVRGVDNDFTYGAGHRLTLPRFSAPVVFVDGYEIQAPGAAAQFSRENRLTVRPGRGWTIDTSSDAFNRDYRLTQGWAGNIGYASEALFTTADANLGLTTLGYTHGEDDYLSSWIGGYRFLVPETGELVDRSIDLGLAASLPPNPLGLEVAIDPSSRSVPEFDDRSQTSSVLARIAMPWSLDEAGSSLLTLSYERALDVTSRESGEGDFGDDARTLFYRLGEQSYLYRQLPVVEIYAPAAKERFVEESATVASANYKPQIALSLERRPGSRLNSLYLPTLMQVSTARSFRKDGDLNDSLYLYSLTYRTNAINLFGRLGAYPTFRFYAIDELSNAVTVDLQYAEDTSLESGTIHLENFLGLEGEGGNLFTMSNRFELAGEALDKRSDRIDVSYLWFIRPEGGVRVPLLSEDLTADSYYQHDESVGLELADLQEGAGHPFTLLASHASSIQLPERGFLKAYLTFGADIERYRDTGGRARIIRLLIQGGIEGKIQF
jgi:hypothetical protein